MWTRTFQLFTMASLAFLFGCNKPQPTDSPAANNPTAETPDEHADPHDVPLTDAEIEALREETATWPAAMERIQQYRDAIKTEMTSGTPAKAHRQLDLLDHVLQWLPEIAQNSDVPKEDWQTVGEKSQELRDLFNEIHANIDAGESPGYEAVADEIDAAVASLAAIKAGESDGASSPE